MNSLEQNIAQDESPKMHTTESADFANETHEEFSDRIVKLAIEGLNRLSAGKAAAKNPRQAA